MIKCHQDLTMARKQLLQLELQSNHNAFQTSVRKLLFCTLNFTIATILIIQTSGHMKMRGRYFTKLNGQMALSLILTLTQTQLPSALYLPYICYWQTQNEIAMPPAPRNVAKNTHCRHLSSNLHMHILNFNSSFTSGQRKRNIVNNTEKTQLIIYET